MTFYYGLSMNCITSPRNLAAVFVLACSALAFGGHIYVTASGNPALDSTVQATLAAAGHTSVTGVPFYQFDGTVSLSGFNAVYLQQNYNQNVAQMPLAGQQQLLAYVNAGGGLMVSEWALYYTTFGHYQTLKQVFPSVETSNYSSLPSISLQKVDADPTINSGLPDTFQISGDSVGGYEALPTLVRPGAKVFYLSTTSGNFVGHSGWDFGNGRVAQFSQVISFNFLADAEGSRLFRNTLQWVLNGTGNAQVNATDVTVRLGRVNAGSVADINALDGQVFQVCKFIVPNQQVAPVTVEVGGTSSVIVPSQLKFRTYGRMSTTGLFSLTLDLYDWTIGAFSTTAVMTKNVNNTFQFAEVFADAPASRFVSGSGRVVGRYRVHQTGPAGAALWCYELDQANWLIRP